MNRFLKTNSPWLTLSVLAVLLLVVAFLLRPTSPEYKINADSSLKLVNDQSSQVAVENLAGKQLVDIRTSDQFVQGHPEGAINIPVRQLLDEESLEMLGQLTKDGRTIVLCGNDELQATAPWLLLQQLGYANVRLLKGGITAGGELKATEAVATETPAIDMSAFQSKPAETPAAGAAKTEAKKPEVVVPVRKAASSGGGC